MHDLWTGLAPRRAVRQWSGWPDRDWLRVALRPQEALLQFPHAEDSLQPSEVAAHHQLRVGFEEEALLLARSCPQGNLWSALVARLRFMRRARVVLLRLARAALLLLARGLALTLLLRSSVLASMLSCLPGPRPIASVTEMTPAVPGGEEAPPAPEVKETSAIGAPTGGLLLPTPSGN